MELTEKMINNPFPMIKLHGVARILGLVQKLRLTSAKPNEIIDPDFLHHFPN
jgi:hypothetical protein